MMKVWNMFLNVNNIIMGKYIIKGSKYGHILFLLMLIAYSACLNSSQCPVSCIQGGIGCKVCFKACIINDETTYLFANCTQTSMNLPRSNISQQIPSTSFTYDIQKCSLECCDDRFKAFQNPTIKSCPISSNSQSNLVIILISVLTVVFVAICCFISGSSKIREKIVAWFWSEKSNSAEKRAIECNKSTSIINMAQIKLSSEQKSSRMSYLQSRDEMCSICLQGKSNVSTFCGHYFHLRCIYEWAIRKLECPLCKSHQIKNISIYCKNCMMEKMEVSLKEVPFMSLQHLSLFECKQCRNK